MLSLAAAGSEREHIIMTLFISRSAMHVRTVLGPIAPEDLGITLGHEHLLIDLRGLWLLSTITAGGVIA